MVYGVFDLNQPVQFIKLSKTFAGTQDPYTLALSREVIFFSDAQVSLSRPDGSNRIPFVRDTGFPRSSGYFPENPNEVYVLNHKLEGGDFLLAVILPSQQDTLTARFTFIDAFKIITPKTGFKRFYFYEDPVLFSWMAVPSAGLYEIALNLNYEERMKNGEIKTCRVSFTRQLSPADLEYDQGRLNYRFFSDSFFAFLGTKIQQDVDVDYRKPVDLELQITAADTTLARYLNWFNLEIDDKINPNGNVTGAIGVVGTKYTVPFPHLILSSRSQDSLIKGKYTKRLDFVSNPDWQ